MIPRSLLLLLFQLFLFLLLFLGRNQISLSVVLLDGPANQKKSQIQFPVWWNIKSCGLTDIAVIKFYTGDLSMSTKNTGQYTASSIYVSKVQSRKFHTSRQGQARVYGHNITPFEFFPKGSYSKYERSGGRGENAKKVRSLLCSV